MNGPATTRPGRVRQTGGARIPAVHTGPIVRVAATVLAFLLGVYGFSTAFAPEDPTHARLADYAFRSLQLVVGHFPPSLDGRRLPLALHVARWALPLLAGWTSIELAWLRCRNQVRLAWIALRGDHLIVAGDDALALRVVLAERLAHHPVILCADDPQARWVEGAADLGAPQVKTPAADSDFAKLGLERARTLLIAGPDDAANVALAALALEQARKVRPSGEPLRVIARVDDPDLRGPLEERFDRAGYRAAARLRFASLPDIAARELFLGSPLDRFVRPGQSGRVVFALGFSPTVERFAVRLLTGGHFQDGVRPTLVVLDSAADREREVFLSRHPGAAGLAPIIFESAPVEQASLIAESLGEAIAKHGAPVLIVTDPPLAARALPLALAVANYFQRRGEIAPPIQVHMAADTKGALDCALFAMGDETSLGDPDLLLQERIDGLARSIHEFYLEGQLCDGAQLGSQGSMYEWDLLPEAVRDDNRLLADCYQLKLRDVGARLIPGSGSGLRFEGQELEALSIAEHQRWMAAKVIDGWTFGETRDDRARRHPNIVPYDDLSDAVKDLDRQQIRILTRLAVQSGRRVVRDLVCAVAPGLAGDGSIAKGLEAAFVRLSEQYPDRAIVLLGEFEDAATRRLLHDGLAAGAPIQLTVARNPELTLEGLDHDAGAIARTLYRASDRLFAVPEVDWPPERRQGFRLERAHIRITGPGAGPSDLPTMTLGSAGRIDFAP